MSKFKITTDQPEAHRQQALAFLLISSVYEAEFLLQFIVGSG
jgi:hypothetical protein